MIARTTLALATLLCVVLAPVAATAQSTPSLPAGITVVGTGSVPVTDAVERFDLRFVPAVGGGPTAYPTCAKAIERLSAIVASAKLPASTIESSAVQYEGGVGVPASPSAVARLHLAPGDFERVATTAEKAGWKAFGQPQLLPRDPAAARDAAYRAALADARGRAQALAAADGRHVGKLLDVQPMLGDYLSSMVTSFSSMAAAFSRGGAISAGVPEVTQSAEFTFELTP